MKIVELSEAIKPFDISLEKGVKYILTDGVVEYISKNVIVSCEELVEVCPEKLYEGQDLTDKSLIAVRNGGIGDLFFISSPFKTLKKLFPTCDLTLACNKKYSDIFYNVQEFKIEHLPLLYSEIENRDYFILFENLIENNPEAETKNAYQLHAEQFCLATDDNNDWETLPIIGIDPIVDRLVKTSLDKFFKDKPLIVIPYAASVAIRSIDPAFWYQFWGVLTQYPIQVIIVASPSQKFEATTLITKFKTETKRTNISIFPDAKEYKGLRGAVSLVNHCSCVLGPDSGLLHIAGALGKPLIGLYGAFPSQLRISTYKMAIGIDIVSKDEILCPFARGIYHSCFQHKGFICDQAEKEVQRYSPCMRYLEIPIIIKGLKDLGII